MRVAQTYFSENVAGHDTYMTDERTKDNCVLEAYVLDVLLYRETDAKYTIRGTTRTCYRNAASADWVSGLQCFNGTVETQLLIYEGNLFTFTRCCTCLHPITPSYATQSSSMLTMLDHAIPLTLRMFSPPPQPPRPSSATLPLTSRRFLLSPRSLSAPMKSTPVLLTTRGLLRFGE